MLLAAAEPPPPPDEPPLPPAPPDDLGAGERDERPPRGMVLVLEFSWQRL